MLQQPYIFVGFFSVGLLLYFIGRGCGTEERPVGPMVHMKGFASTGDFASCSQQLALRDERVVSFPPRVPPGDAVREFRKYLDTHQWSAGEQYEFNQGLNPREYTGFGSRVTVMGATMAHALTNNQVFTVPGEWLWTDPERCPSRDHRCYFQSVGSPYAAGLVVDSFRTRESKTQVDWDNPQLTKWNLSPFQIASELTYYLLQPNSNMLGDIRVAQEVLHWNELPRPILALHVRHGKKSFEGKYYSNDDFMTAVLTMRDRHGFRSLFLLTDDLETSKYFETNATAHFEAVVSLDEPRYVQHGWKESEKHLRDAAQRVKSGGNGCSEAVSTMLNIYIASLADGFVGVFNSNMSRTIMKMMTALNGGTPPPNVSLDNFYTTLDKGSCWHDFLCRGRKENLVKTVWEPYPMTTSLV